MRFFSSGWAQINIDGVAMGSPSLASCGIFRGSMRKFISGFSYFLNIHNVMVAEFYGVIHAIEEAKNMGFPCLYLECDSFLVCIAFTTKTNAP